MIWTQFEWLLDNLRANITGACVFDPINRDECENREKITFVTVITGQ